MIELYDVFNHTEFEWDNGNSDKSHKKHNVTPEESEEIFANDPLIISSDLKHSWDESRFLALGRTDNNRKLYVVFTMRGIKIRIISARPMNKKERTIYEKA